MTTLNDPAFDDRFDLLTAAYHMIDLVSSNANLATNGPNSFPKRAHIWKSAPIPALTNERFLILNGYIYST